MQMSTSAFTLMLLNLAYIGLLPRLFFRRDGHLNLKWWATAAPFFVCTFVVTLHYIGVLQRPIGVDAAGVYEAVATSLSVASVALISLTLGTHRRRLSLWHQSNDRPDEIVTYGAYRFIRHPFYAAFILALFAAVSLCPSVWTAGTCLYGLIMLNYTAAREERMLLRSAFGAQYAAYVGRTARFLPGPGRLREFGGAG
jgi:protein-S-isoprenylcysteine O-methyltransferase Ste14